MKTRTKDTVWLLAATIFLAGCSYQRTVYLKRTGLPEYIYKIPLKNNYISANVGVFNFREPPYARGMGRVAAESVYHQLLIDKIFVSVTHEADVKDLRLENLMQIAHDRGYDLIITGDLLYYFEGGLHQPSRVDQRIRVMDVEKNAILWYAKATDIGPCAPDTDYAVVKGRGAPAPTTRTLFKRNADKFALMLLSQPPQAFLATTTKNNTQQSSQAAPQVETGAQAGTARYLRLGLDDQPDYGPASASEPQGKATSNTK